MNQFHPPNSKVDHASVGCSGAGLKLIVDNSTSPNSHLGPHTRVSWSVDTTSIDFKTAAVALAISSEDMSTLRMVAFTLFQTRVDPRTGTPLSLIHI